MSHYQRLQIVSDAHGVSFTCSEPESLKAYNESIQRFLELKDWSGDGNGILSETLQHDKWFLMGYIYIASQLIRSRGTAPNLDDHDARIKSLIKECDTLLTNAPFHRFQRRELLYLNALKSSFNGQTKKALSTWRRIVELNSFDILALLLLHYGFMGIGDVSGTVRSIRCVITDFEREAPSTLPYIHGLYSMALQENREYERAWKYAHLSLESDPSIVSAFHSKIHILHEIGHDVAAIQCCSEQKRHWILNQKTPHVAWHWMVSHIAVGHYREALQLFDVWFTDKKGGDIGIRNNVHCRDAASFLWRMELSEYEMDSELKNEVKFRWSLCRKYIDQQLHKRHIDVYGDSYYLMALIRNEPEETLHFLSALKSKSKRHCAANTGHSYYTETAPMAAIPILEGITEGFVNGRYGEGFDIMYRTIVDEDNNWRMGGSTAQKEIFPMTMREMAFRAGKYLTLKSLLKEQLQTRPVWNCSALSQLSRFHEEVERDYATAAMYGTMRKKVIAMQHRAIEGKSLDEYPTFSSQDIGSKL